MYSDSGSREQPISEPMESRLRLDFINHMVE